MPEYIKKDNDTDNKNNQEESEKRRKEKQMRIKQLLQSSKIPTNLDNHI